MDKNLNPMGMRIEIINRDGDGESKIRPIAIPTSKPSQWLPKFIIVLIVSTVPTLFENMI